MGRKLLITGSILNFVIGALHIVALFFLDWALEFSGGDQMYDKLPVAQIPGSPYTETVIVAVLFILMGLYGLSAARVVRKFPLLKPGIALITIVYIARGVLGLAYEFLSQKMWINGIVFSTIALLIGICYLYGGLWRWHGRGHGKYYDNIG